MVGVENVSGDHAGELDQAFDRVQDELGHNKSEGSRRMTLSIAFEAALLRVGYLARWRVTVKGVPAA